MVSVSLYFLVISSCSSLYYLNVFAVVPINGTVAIVRTNFLGPLLGTLLGALLMGTLLVGPLEILSYYSYSF